MKKLVIFDLDGTLIDSGQDISTAIAYAAHTVCHLPAGTVTLEQTASLLGKNLHDTFSSLLAPEYHTQIEDCILAYRQYYLQNCANATVVFPGLLDLLLELKGQGYKLAIATTKFQSTVDIVAERLKLTAYFDLVQGVDGFPSKPDPYILNEVMRKLEVTPAETVMVGDTDNDVLCAQRAGVEVCAITWGAWSETQLATLQPDYIARSVEELHNLLTTEATSKCYNK